jgi:hypothetical protein
MTASIPTEADWRSEDWGVDVPKAYQHFFGKSHKEAVALFSENSLLYQEDIMFMPAACFRFYVHAYMDYLMSPESNGDSDGANCFFGVVEQRCKDIKAAGEAMTQSVAEVLAGLAANQERFDAPPDVYGDFGLRTARCQQMINSEM